MASYIGCELIEAESMTRGDYNHLRGWDVPANEDSTDEGYLIKHESNYVNWMPKDIFEKHHFKLLSDKAELLEGLSRFDSQDLEKFKGKEFVVIRDLPPFPQGSGLFLGGTIKIDDECSIFEKLMQLWELSK